MLVPRSRWEQRRYYVEDGLLKPVPGSKGQPYDPFAADPLPYIALASLDTSDERSVESFVTRFGLLGLFQERLQDSRNLPLVLAEAQGLEELAKQIGASVPWYAPDYLPGLSCEPDSRSVNRTSEVIYSDELWNYLAEPLEEFRTAAGEFRAACELAARMEEGRMSAADAESLKKRLARGTRGVQSEDNYTMAEDGSAVVGWTRTRSFPSLLSACYQQLREELLGNRAPRVCKNERCPKLFTPISKKHFYCCDACGNAQEQRERRRRSKNGEFTAVPAATALRDR